MSRKLWRIVLTTGVLASLLMSIGLTAATASPSGPPGNGWYTGEQVQNVDSAGQPATIQITAYDMTGQSFPAATQVVNAGASYTFMPANFPNMPSGFTGSAVVSSDKNILAVVNVTNVPCCNPPLGTPGGTAVESYQGLNPGPTDTAVNFPLAKNAFYGNSTTFYVQNAGTTPANLDFKFSMPGCDADHVINNVAAYVMTAVMPSDAHCQSGTYGSLSVTQQGTSVPLAGVSIESPSTVPPGGAIGYVASTNGFGPSSADTTVYAPIMKRNLYNRFTGLQVQNADSSAIQAGNIVVTYTFGNGQTATETNSAVLQPGQSFTFFGGPLANGTLAGAVASTSTTTNQKIVAIVNEQTISGSPALTTYYALPAHLATSKISAPMYKEFVYGRGTGLQIFALNGSAATFRLTITTNSGRTVILHNTNPAPNFTFYQLSHQSSYVTFDQGSPSDLNSTVSGVTAVGQLGNGNPVNIAAIANETSLPGSAVMNDSNYEGFNMAP